jgi:hypothetical protein
VDFFVPQPIGQLKDARRFELRPGSPWVSGIACHHLQFGTKASANCCTILRSSALSKARIGTMYTFPGRHGSKPGYTTGGFIAFIAHTAQVSTLGSKPVQRNKVLPN